MLPVPSFCLLACLVASQEPAPPTWSGEVAALVHAHCGECHRPDQAAPFPLLDYRDVAKRARTLLRVVERGAMPPWQPTEGADVFRGARGLTAEQRDLLARWVAAGAPEGDPSRAPAPPTFSSGWAIGTPDLVVRMPEPFVVPAAGPDIYRNFVFPLGQAETRWVRAVEVRPSARTVVHHALFFQDATDGSRRADADDPEPGFSGMGLGLRSLGGWAVGAAPYHLPDGFALELPAGADLVVQTHFHPSGKEEREATELALAFADEAPERPVVSILLPPSYGAFAGLDLPAGDADWHLRDRMTLPVDTELLLAGAHAHYLAKSVRAWAVLPDGTERPLLTIDDWDFAWQGSYEYVQPVLLPAGTELCADLRYDNSADNPRNPSVPPRRVTWGLESTDEMGAATFLAVAARVEDHAALRDAVRDKARAARRERVEVAVDWYARVMRLDKDGDGELSADEIPSAYRQGLSRLDRDGDGALSKDELARLRERTAGEQGGDG